MNPSTNARTGVRLRPIALPMEHGGWSFLGAPVLLGLLVAPTPAGFWLSLAALGAFLTRQPLKLALGDWRRGKRFPRTAWAERFALLYGAIALGAFTAAWLTAAHPFWLPLTLAAPLAAVQLFYDLRKQSRATVAELSGAAAISSVAAAIAMAAGRPPGPALLLWLLLALQAIPAILYVATRLRLARGERARRGPALGAHGLALGVVGGLAWAGPVSWLVVGVFALLTLRAALGMVPRSLRTPTPLVGCKSWRGAW
jgi:hypothetical protein